MPRDREPESDELFEMANLYPRTTGLPMTVWVSPRGNARHDVRVKVNRGQGDQRPFDITAAVAVRPSPHLIAGRLPGENGRPVFHGTQLNRLGLSPSGDG